MEIYGSKSDRPLLDWQWYEPSLRNITHLLLKSVPRTGGHALDVGCGTGRVSFELAKRGYQVQGIDIQERAIQLARRIAEGRGVSVQFDVADFSRRDRIRPDFFDLVVCSEVLEHVDDYRPFIQNMYATLKPNGRIIITVPFDPRKWSVLDVYGGHVRRFTIDQIRADLRQFSNVKITVTGFPFYRLLVRAYLAKIRLFQQKHSNEELWEKPGTRLVSTLVYPFMRIDNVFAFSRLGDALVATAEKRGAS